MSVLLVTLVLAVMQLGLALHVRNTTLDAAAEGARYAALADTGIESGAARTRELIGSAIAESYASDVTAVEELQHGVPTIVVTVRTGIPIVGLISIPGTMEVAGRAAVETID